MAITLNGTTGIASTGAYSSDGISFADNTPADTLVTTTGGNVGIGTSSPSNNSGYGGLTLNGSTGGQLSFYTSNSLKSTIFSDTTNLYLFNATASGAMTFSTNSTERMRIDSSGNLLLGKTGTTDSTGIGIIFRPSIGNMTCTGNDATTAFNTYHLYNLNATNNGYRFYVNMNGGISNYSGNNINLSDERTKTNIEISGNYLDKICAIPVKLFNYKDEAEGEQKTLGVIAQDVEAVAPEFVNNDGWEGTAPEDGVPLKTIYTTDMMFGLMKAIQEQQAIITDLKARIETLENK